MLIGMESRVEDVVSSLEIGINDVRVIGIKGMGGSGKTTLARAVFDQINHSFEGQSFVANVREVSKASLYGLSSLQKQILSDVSKDKDIKVNDVYDGKNKIKRMMPGRRVLVVLDDVDYIDQLNGLVVEPKWYKPGSRIIITTRDEDVLKVRHVKLIIHDVNLLLKEEAICLFSRYAFGTETPIQGYEDLSKQVVHYADGLPLTITVLGSFLCGKDKFEWKDALERLKTIPLKETHEKLEISYNGLEEDYKEIFLDVACLLKGWKKDKAIRALESQGCNARIGLRVLEEKSLITISEENCLNMHDHIEEMGKNIVRGLHPDEPWTHSRLWIEAEIKDILANDKGTKATRGIRIYSEEFDPEVFMRGLRKMEKLRFLCVELKYDAYDSDYDYDYDYYDDDDDDDDGYDGDDDDDSQCDREFDKCGQYLPNSLQYLRWVRFPLARLWKKGEGKALNNLRFLDLSSSKLVTFDFELIPKLKFLYLAYSTLRILNLGQTPDLETLNLNKCNDLVELHIPFRCPKLKSIFLECSKLSILDLGRTSDLEILSLVGFDSLKLQLPDKCPKLKSLDLKSSTLRNLTLGQAPDLESISLDGCCDLVELHMPYRYPKLKSITVKCSKLKTLDRRLISNLERLSLEGCDLVEIHMPDECPKLKFLSLKNLKLRNITLGSTPDLQALTFEGCCDLVELHMPFGCPELKSLRFKSCWLLEKLPEDLDLLECLEQLIITDCILLRGIPNSICKMKRLKYLIITDCILLRGIPNSICKMKRLKYLHLPNCVLVETLPEELGRLESLKELNLKGTGVSKLPQSIFRLKGLLIFGTKWQLQSYEITSVIHTTLFGTFCVI